MKKIIFFVLAITMLISESQGQTSPYTKLALAFSDGDGSVVSEYYIDANKVLHWRVTAEAYNPFAYDGNPADNMIQFNVAGISTAEYFLDAQSFPYGQAGVWTGTVSLSGLTNEQISQTEIQTAFWFRVNDELGEFKNYAAFDYGSWSYIEL